MTETRECSKHGLTTYRKYGKTGYKCSKCLSEAVKRTRLKNRATLVAEAGGECAICGYSKWRGALHFHHKDPQTKSFGLSGRKQTNSLKTLREEAQKCILLCANCHSEVEGGITTLPVSIAGDVRDS